MNKITLKMKYSAPGSKFTLQSCLLLILQPVCVSVSPEACVDVTQLIEMSKPVSFWDGFELMWNSGLIVMQN